jgi:hypothetical protein
MSKSTIAFFDAEAASAMAPAGSMLTDQFKPGGASSSAATDPFAPGAVSQRLAEGGVKRMPGAPTAQEPPPADAPRAPLDVAMISFRARAEKAKAELDANTEDMNQSIEGLEAALFGLGLGVAASATLDDDGGWIQLLRFQKEGKTWRLMVGSGDAHDDREFQYSPLVTASRWVRLKALEMVPELIEALITETERQAEQIGKKAAATKVLATKLKGGVK